MGGKSSAPAAPDPTATAAAQTQSNQQTAAYQTALNNYNTYTPLGNSTWQQTGTDPTTGAPTWAQTVSLTPTAQSTLNQDMSNSNQLSQAQGQLLGNVQSSIAQPIDTSGLPGIASSVQGGNLGSAGAQQAINASYGQQMGLLQPQFNQQNTSIQAQLANQGITPGSEAYNNAMNNQSMQQNFATTQAADNAVGQGINYQNQQYNQGLQSAGLQNSANGQQLQQLFALNDQPMNMYNSMMSGTQVQMPSFNSGSQAQVGQTNVLGAQQMAYNGQLNAYNAQTGTQNSELGAGASIAAAAAIAF